MPYEMEGRTPFGRSRAEDRVAFVRNVYLWLMGGFGVAHLAFKFPELLFERTAGASV